jgi:hypothetical protein
MHYSCGHCDQCRQHGWKANCRWATTEEQASNKSNTNLLRHPDTGVIMSTASWERELGFGAGTIVSRLREGWSIRESLTTPLKKNIGRPRSKYVRCESCRGTGYVCEDGRAPGHAVPVAPRLSRSGSLEAAISEMARGTQPAHTNELGARAAATVARVEARSKVNVDAWAAALAEDVADLDD